MEIKWHVNIKTGIVESECGFQCEFQRNLLVEISRVPKNATTKEIKQYSIDATTG